MVVIMEDFGKPSFNTLEEVKKLQDLVRKLEIQNQQLRNKQNKSSRKSSNSGQKENAKSQSPNILKSAVDEKTTDVDPVIVGNCNNNFSTSEDAFSGSRNANTSCFDEIEILKLSDVEMSDDDSWLYTLPRGLTPEQKKESPHEWLRKDVDDPHNKELQLAKKALITKLNELEILSPISQRSQPMASKMVYPAANKPANNFSKPRVPYKFVSSTQEHVHSVLDTRTFTKSKKKQALEYLAATLPLETTIETSNAECELFRRGSDVSLDSSTSTYTLADANDVQEVARMQEESLRMNSPISTPKRQQSVNSNHSGRRMSVSSKSSVSDIDNTEFPSLNSQYSFDESTCRAITVTPTSIPLEKPNYSDHSSPSQSPYGSNASLSNVSDEKRDVYRRSLPNLNRGRPDARKLSLTEKKKQKSFATKTGAAGRRSDSNLLLAASSKSRRETVSPMRNRMKQPSNYSPTTPTSNLSKMKESSPLPPRSAETSSARQPVRSGLPRPSRATSATRAWSSGIPVPSMANKKHNEDSWSDGCF